MGSLLSTGFLLFLSPALLAGGFVVNSFDAPNTSVTGLAFAEGHLFSVSSDGMVYRMDPSDGTVLASFPTNFSVADGIGYAGDLLYITRGTYHVTKFTTSGEHAGYTALDDWKGEEGFSADRSHDALHMYWPVSGAAGSATHVFWIGNQVYPNHFMYYTPLPTPGYITWPPYGGQIPTSLTTYDFTREGDDNLSSDDLFWVATDDPDSPIRAYTLGAVLTDGISEVNPVRGMAYSTDNGSRYLWASNPDNHRIYQIQLDAVMITESSGVCLPPLEVSPSRNPFSGTVSFLGTGIQGVASITVFDTAGRAVLEASFPGVFTWQASGSPQGVYFVQVRSTEGQEALLRVVRL